MNWTHTQNVIKRKFPANRWPALNTHPHTARKRNTTPLEGYTGTVEVNVGLPITRLCHTTALQELQNRGNNFVSCLSWWYLKGTSSPGLGWDPQHHEGLCCHSNVQYYPQALGELGQMPTSTKRSAVSCTKFPDTFSQKVVTLYIPKETLIKS